MKLIAFLILLSSIVWAKSNIKVMIVDTGIDLSHKEIKQYVKEEDWDLPDYFDSHGHGTHVAGLVLKDLCPEVQMISCKYTTGRMVTYTSNSVICFKKALKENVDLINYSSGGSFANEDEFLTLLDLDLKHITFVTASGNNGEDLSNPFNNFYPAKYKLSNIIVVGNLNEDGTRNSTSNYGLKGMFWEVGTNVLSTLPNSEFGYMTGSSMATAVKSNKILKGMCDGLRR